MANSERRGGLKDVDAARDPETPCEEQVRLAKSPLIVVRRVLAENPSLCTPAREVLGDELGELRQVEGDKARDVLE